MSREITNQWIERAEADHKAAKILIESDPLILDIACFHLQQSIEKYLKAYLVYHNLDFQFTHDLEYLAIRCSEVDNEFSLLEFGRLTMFAVRARYPHDHIAPNETEISDYLELLQGICHMVNEKVKQKGP